MRKGYFMQNIAYSVKDVAGHQSIMDIEDKDKKTLFLNNLKTVNGKNKYRRFLGSPLRYAGGKSLAVGTILEQIPKDTKRVISPFIGGGSFEIACSTYAGIEVIGFDIFDILINYWQQQIKNPKKLAKKLKNFQPTHAGFKEVKEKLKSHWQNSELIDDSLELASYYYYNHNTSYGPGFLSWPSSVYMQEKRYSTMVQKVADTKLENISVYQGSFEHVIPKYKNDMLYCDPPYYLEGDSKMFKGIYPQRNFPIHHNGFDHEKLRDLLLEHKGGFVLSYNDCTTIRNWYKDFEFVEVSWQYTMGQGETRIGSNRQKNGDNHIKKSHEVLIIKR